MRFLKAAACILCATSMTAHAEAPDGAEFAFVIKIFEKIQEQSFAANRELCGYLGYGPDGELMTTRINRGEEAACYLPTWPAKMDVIASFHTHSTYNPDYNSELPSSTDMESDEDSGIDGWVATPGGRLWYIDSSEMMAYQVCGVGCLPQDPNFVDEPAGAIKPSYTTAVSSRVSRSSPSPLSLERDKCAGTMTTDFRMTHPRFFGYGSLVNLTTHTYPDPKPAKLRGWRRVWRHTQIQEPAFLSVEPCDRTTLLGVTAAVPNADWAALDERESGYLRRDVTHLIDDAVQSTAVYEVDAAHYLEPVTRPILLSYLDVVVQGYLRVFGDEGADHFFDTTHNWGPILNDREAPRYPRARTLTAEETARVNAGLAALGQPLD